ncbi:unnamed protein product [Nippostrongylus brasiliensis]|uniref:Putative cortactin (inferred by orthology to a S. mansoni protein) n=1 Tax=Nippostrongylus brasiliensis TaxID=27835 RepID=A0A0N4XHJ5_NIPBR|nr:unnamed protein product [Nippostrongylus brasiliensis]
MESIQKSLEGLSMEDKVAKLLKRLVDSEEHNTKLKEKASQVDKLTKANTSLEKKLEKANLILLKTEDAKGKLEELCRELQKMNKQIREDSLNKVRLLEHERQQAVEQLRTALKVSCSFFTFNGNVFFEKTSAMFSILFYIAHVKKTVVIIFSLELLLQSLTHRNHHTYSFFVILLLQIF